MYTESNQAAHNSDASKHIYFEWKAEGFHLSVDLSVLVCSENPQLNRIPLTEKSDWGLTLIDTRCLHLALALDLCHIYFNQVYL